MGTFTPQERDVFSPQHSSRVRSGGLFRDELHGLTIGPGGLTPPSSGSQHDRVVPQMLMSPPPEEELRSTRARSTDSRFSSSPQKPRTSSQASRNADTQAAKRKRTRAAVGDRQYRTASDVVPDSPVASTSRVTIDVTPNPKPRKQSKYNAVADEPTTPTKSSRPRASTSPTKHALLRSPHASNPHADYLPDLPESSCSAVLRHRAVTPLPHYEPPPDRFTPPREVVYTPVPSVSKSSKRKSTPWSRMKNKERRLTIQIKKEPPEIDLSAPLPPGSPTDDPLLLYGPPPSTKKKKRPPRASAVPMYARDTPPISSTSPIRAPMTDQTQLIDITAMDGIDTSDGLDDTDVVEPAPLPSILTINNEGADAWSEDEPESANDGQFTEKYKTLAVPTKADPPSSCTKERMDRWGRPVSPFPYQTSHNALHDEEDELPTSHLEQDREPSPATVHPTVLAAADNAQTSLQVGPVDAVFSDEWDYKEPPPSTSPMSSPFILPSRVNVGQADLEYETLPPSDPISPQSSSSRASSEDTYRHNDTIIEYEVPLAGADYSSSEAGDDLLDDEFLSSAQTRTAFDATPAQDIHAEQSPFGPSPPTHEAVHRAHAGMTPSDKNEQIFALPAISHDETATVSPEPAAHRDDGVVIDDEEEDAESVVRELSHEPDFRDDGEDQGNDEHLRPLPAPALQVISSPHNPFQSHSPHSSVTTSRPEKVMHVKPVSSPSSNATEVLVRAEDEDTGLEDFDPSVVKITSEDPMAAARAAAILRLHKYDCLEKPVAPNRPPSLLESLMKSSRRKSVVQSGITKSTPASSQRRRTLGGMVGDKVIRPGSPAVTLPQLLKEAEESLIMEEDGPIIGLPVAAVSLSGQSSKDFQTPGRTVAGQPSDSLPPPIGNRDWSKLDWKVLDGCYTDERLAIGKQQGRATMASVDEVNPDHVVDRYLGLLGGDAIEEPGSAWSRSNLLKRVRALKRKQSAGNVALPSNSPSAAASRNYWTPSQNYSMLMSPNMSLFEDLLPLPKHDTRSKPSEQPTDPRANHQITTKSSSRVDQSGRSRFGMPDRPRPPPPSLANKVKGLFYSYLPKASSIPKPSQAPTKAQAPVLPAPPPELFRRPRAPIVTPAPKPAPKPPHPRDLVHLNHVSLPKPSLPRPTSMSESQGATKSIPSRSSLPKDSTAISRERRDSGASVKDLVKTFESMEQLQAASVRAGRALEAKKKSSREGLRDTNPKPTWRP
ncbi:hypothetical protein BDW22DRAFT_311571 [Trametopsis cervina]|nr:hypothetical protein BDW22DRAFT_311571 [Trametopsis cervina]